VCVSKTRSGRTGDEVRSLGAPNPSKLLKDLSLTARTGLAGRGPSPHPHEIPQVEGVSNEVTRTPLTTRGRRQKGTLARSRSLHAAVTGDVIAALDRWIASQPKPKPNRADVVRLALDQWAARQEVPITHEDRDKLERHIDLLEARWPTSSQLLPANQVRRLAWPCSAAVERKMSWPKRKTNGRRRQSERAARFISEFQRRHLVFSS
jgi:hypothetical protein